MKDLYYYVNGPWLKSHTIPDDRAVDGTFHQLRDQAEQDVHELVKKDQGRAGIFYSGFMDTEAIDAAGMAPLRPDLELLTCKNIDEFAENLGRLDRAGIPSPLTFWIEKDSIGENAIAYLIQSGLGLPDEAYYREEAHAETLEKYHQHIGHMLEFLSEEELFGLDAKTAADRIFSLEKEIASYHWDVVSTRDAMKTYNPTTVDQLPSIIQRLLRGAGITEGAVISMMPSFVDHLAEMLSADRLADWQLWATWQILNARSNLLPQEVGNRNFEFYGTELSGATKQRDRWKRGVGLAERMVGHEIGQLYVEKHFPASYRAEMQQLVHYLIEAYQQRISQLTWMTEPTRRRALVKLEKFRAKIGYPDQPRSYDGMELKPGGENLLENVRVGARYLHDYELAKLGKPANRDEWFATPQTVNAFYNPVVNDITFPAAILRPPFYNPDADAAENFGAIGAVIGHEIGHGFDDQGSRYDGEGDLNSWWTDEDREAFTALTDNLVNQYDGLVPTVLKEAGINSKGVNGSFTLGENIGDLGGLGIAVVAYQNWVKDHGDCEAYTFDAEGADPELQERSFTGMQRLFLSWARIWRTAIRPQMAQQYLAIDPHSPAEFRCNVIAGNIDEFYEAFPEIDEDSSMWIAPEDRVTIW
ncbi:peptidase M13 [Corynebacterium poyangense]|uniref:Peptidase M13 n=1 Tax=Corynebacterium poyangense TaxID=2684405 RepID=A0A7H0SLB0_9CORY|nr:M13-type metalloendopeptidase [Corynebacterium poyangense]MBZ8177426.1 peptidase M13 [Corynebacterium poyangense]QNQ89335.1 peptidase M13 [Corynebacterium poyangense]